MSETSLARHAYGYQRKTTLDLTAAIAAITAALKEEGFGVLMSLDLQATLRQKLGVERPPYTILGACNPALANQALAQELEIGLLLPCNVVVYTGADGKTVVSAVDPEALFTVTGRDDLAPLAREVGARLSRALERLPA
ncbi:MAG: hypothetical protein RLZZ387_4609 [Chloroflexota bacterium]|jgi:uncharacterized protein (DUF302 family)